MNFIKHNWGYVFFLPFIFIGFSIINTFAYSSCEDNYNISYSHIVGQVIALEDTGYGTKVILNNGYVTLPDNSNLILGGTYDFTYKQYEIKGTSWWDKWVGQKDATLDSFSLTEVR